MSHSERLHALDGLRAFALLLGIALHASMSFIPGLPPGIWSTVDESPSTPLAQFFLVTHLFRMSLFFVIAGYFARLLVQRQGIAGFWANRLTRIGLPLLAGWLVLWPAIGAVWGWGLKELFGGQIPARPAQMQMPAGYFPLMHLWFLYYLLMGYAALMIVRTLVRRVDAQGRLRALGQRAFARVLAAGAAPVVLALPIVTVLATLPRWLLWQGVPTPDMTLIPQLPSLVVCGVSLATGWALHRAPDLLSLVSRRAFVHLAIAVLAVGACLVKAGPRFTFVPLAGTEKLLYAFAYGVGAWASVLALTGLALRFLATESRVRRYLADASYFLYLAHLPVVGTLAVVVRHWPVHWSLKFGFVLGATLAVLLLVYHVAVRPSFIGRVLNGRTVPLRRKASGAPAMASPASGPTSDAIAELRSVRKVYGKRVALDDVDVQVRPGELLALLGPNGAGKSTAIGLWLGLHGADAGDVRVAGGSPHDVARRRHVGVMMQDVALPQGLRVRELIAQAAAAYPAPRTLDETLVMAGIGALADRRYDKLSGGQKRQVQFALALCGRPSLLFLDEPSVGLDIEAREAMWRAIRGLLREGAAVVLTTHYLEEAEALADRVAVLAQGHVVASGAVDEIRSLVSRREIRCESALDVDTLRSWPGVLAARADDRSLTLTVSDAESVLRRLLAADLDLKRLEVRQAGLAEAFAQLTQEAA